MEHRPPSHDIIHAPSLEQIGFEEYEPPEGFCIPVRLRFSPALAYRSTTNSTRAASPAGRTAALWCR